jgi:4-amino-4-deoxy-L-arabinose transferase-like glycosyltransferase
MIISAKQKYLIFALSMILLVGIFVRTYHFSDWLRFNADQARDAIVVHDAATGNGPIPLLGPKAGGTTFKLGPAFYYMQLVSVKIFGYEAQKYAYPDLLFSVLTILMIYIFIARLFGNKIALAAAAVCSVSFFMVRYGRFAWNPNSTSFFVLLFLLSAQAIGENRTRKIIWTILMGISLGIGVQLHTFLLLVLPVIAIAFFAYLFWSKNFSWKNFLIVLLAAIFLNVPQIISEFQTGFANVQAFNGGVETKTASSYSIVERMGMDLKCHATSNAYILSSRGETDECNQFYLENTLNVKKSSQFSAWEIFFARFSIALSIIFSIGGYLLLTMFAYREEDKGKKILLGLTLLYILASFVAFVPIGNELSMRYFLTGAFVPFLLLAAWMKFILDRFKKLSMIVYLGVALLCVSGVLMLQSEAKNFETGKISDSDTSVLGEIRPLADFMTKNSNGVKMVYLTGESGYVRRFNKPLEYLVNLKGLSLQQIGEGNPLSDMKESGTLFYIDKKSNRNSKLLERGGFPVQKTETFGKISLFLLGQ